MEFKVPKNYFKNFEVEIFEKLKLKKIVFTVPTKYFENIGCFNSQLPRFG